jgi:hypothetical protein
MKFSGLKIKIYDAKSNDVMFKSKADLSEETFELLKLKFGKEKRK